MKVFGFMHISLRPSLLAGYGEVRPRLGRRVTLLGVTVCLLIFGSCIHSYGKGFVEGQVKAVFLYNLTKFITWPPSDERDRRKEFTIGLIGEDELFASSLQRAIHDEDVGGRKIVLKRYEYGSHIEWETIDLLFVGKAHRFGFNEIGRRSQEHSVLSVGENSIFCPSGGMVSLLTVKKRIRLQVNIEAVQAGRFRVSAQVLRLADLVKTAKRGKP